jgi:hypothetical protein
MTSEEMMRAGQAARNLLENDDFKLGIQAIRDMAQRNWAATNPEQVKEREEFYYLNLATTILEAHFRSLAENGRFEERKAADLEARAKQANQGE